MMIGCASIYMSKESYGVSPIQSLMLFPALNSENPLFTWGGFEVTDLLMPPKPIGRNFPTSQDGHAEDELLKRLFCFFLLRLCRFH